MCIVMVQQGSFIGKFTKEMRTQGSLTLGRWDPSHDGLDETSGENESELFADNHLNFDFQSSEFLELKGLFHQLSATARDSFLGPTRLIGCSPPA